MLCTECGNTTGIEQSQGSLCCSLCGKELQNFELEEGENDDSKTT